MATSLMSRATRLVRVDDVQLRVLFYAFGEKTFLKARVRQFPGNSARRLNMAT
jgi:hypothetical protein